MVLVVELMMMFMAMKMIDDGDYDGDDEYGNFGSEPPLVDAATSSLTREDETQRGEANAEGREPPDTLEQIGHEVAADGQGHEHPV